MCVLTKHFLILGVIAYCLLQITPKEEVQSPNPIETQKVALLLRKSDNFAKMVTTFGLGFLGRFALLPSPLLPPATVCPPSLRGEGGLFVLALVPRFLNVVHPYIYHGCHLRQALEPECKNCGAVHTTAWPHTPWVVLSGCATHLS